MGFNINIYDDYENNFPSYITSFSYNWSVFRDIFYIKDADGKSSKVVAGMLEEGLDILNQMGYSPNRAMRVDGWGADDRCADVKTFGNKEYDRDLHCMFAYFLKEFLDLAKQYPRAKWEVH